LPILSKARSQRTVGLVCIDESGVGENATVKEIQWRKTTL
jgi:hypothetical protein